MEDSINLYRSDINVVWSNKSDIHILFSDLLDHTMWRDNKKAKITVYVLLLYIFS